MGPRRDTFPKASTKRRRLHRFSGHRHGEDTLSMFDHWLKGMKNEVDEWPRTRYFVMGENIWRNTEQKWPPKGELFTLYLKSENGANTLLGDGRLIPDPPPKTRFDEYAYDPSDPVITQLGFDLYGERQETLLDNRFIQRRDDVLVYSSDPMKEEIMVLGYPVVELQASSDCPDTDWFATLSDVSQDGRSTTVAHGGIRARYREGLNKQVLAESGKVYVYTIKLSSTCVTFLKSHQIRLHITSSDFPSFAPNSNTGNHPTEDTEKRIAYNRVHNGSKFTSKIDLTFIK